ncbi:MULTISPECIES: ABC transporter permease [unclassified Caulobacter]|uniref:ABC transporter permease n=1 Tax=unclassified Caulobacter TaxID=2648921 RepID=UPI0006F94D64|nr:MULTISPECIES: ABC transporter permease [unclassified Caulobacter]KQV58596.1 ABC transporter permease [Caulobacter sp. Root342]KQV68895.1 ABC transporter permease [Caulobacter sp. Root343]
MKRVLAPLILIAVLLGGWEVTCRILAVPSYLLPTPSAIWSAFLQSWPLLLASAWATLSTALLALIIASLAACALALAVSLSGVLEDAVRPIAVTLQVTPLVAIAPLVTIWAGIDHPERAVVGLAAVVAFFPIFSGALTGLKAVDPDLARLFDLYGASPVHRLVRLRLPSAVPALLEGHKVAAGLAVIGAVVAEFVAGSGGAQGLAWRILEAYNRLQTAKVFAALLTLAVLGVVLHTAMEQLERRLLDSWRGR